jgi:hypothetical protein
MHEWDEQIDECEYELNKVIGYTEDTCVGEILFDSLDKIGNNIMKLNSIRLLPINDSILHAPTRIKTTESNSFHEAKDHFNNISHDSDEKSKIEP